MNIDLRNVSVTFEDNINKIKREYRCKTNTQAVEICVINFLKTTEKKEDLIRELNDTKRELREIKEKINLGIEVFRFLEKVK